MEGSSDLIKLPIISKRWNKSVTSQDIPPTSITNTNSTHPTTHNLLESPQASQSLFLSNNDSVNNSNNNTRICTTCEINEARYTCPRCEAPYCSIECYRLHKTRKGADNESRSNKAHPCTEGFYKERVFDMLRNETKDPDNISTMKQILQRSRTDYEDSNSTKKVEDGEEDDPNPLFQDETLEQEFMDLASHVLKINITPNSNGSTLTGQNKVNTNNNHGETEEGKGNDPNIEVEIKRDSDMDEQIEELLFETLQSKPHLLKYFENLAVNGELSHLIPTWDPWWMPSRPPTEKISVTSTETNTSSQMNEDQQRKKHNNKIKTLDEQIMSIPPFHTLLSTKQRELLQSLKDTKLPSLHFNTINLLYTTAQILRLYNGYSTSSLDTDKYNDNNITKNGDNGEVASALYSTSSVLNQDCRYISVEEVLIDCATQSTRQYNDMTNRGSSTGSCNTPWYILTQDVLLILRNKRFVCKALITAKDILQKGIQSLRDQLKSKLDCKVSQNDSDYDDIFPRDDNTIQYQVQWIESNLKKLRHSKKKIIYYTSWCIAYWSELELENSLSKEVQDWMNRWRPPNDKEVYLDSTTVFSNLSSKANSTSMGNERKKNKNNKKTLSQKELNLVHSNDLPMSRNLIKEVQTMRKIKK